MRTRLFFLNQNFPREVILSASMLRFFSCTKSLLMLSVFWVAELKACLKASWFFSGVKPGYWALAVRIKKKPARRKQSLHIRIQIKQFIQSHDLVSFLFRLTDQFGQDIDRGLAGIMKEQDGAGCQGPDHFFQEPVLIPDHGIQGANAPADRNKPTPFHCFFQVGIGY